MTIGIPTPSADLISQIENATIEASQSETAAIAAIRDRFTPYAKHNGYIRIAYSSVGNSNWHHESELYYEHDGKRVKALLVCDEFDTENTDQNRGNYTGWRLYLTANGEWLKIKRDGNWSRREGGEGWGCGCSAESNEMGDDYGADMGGYVKTLTDEQVAAQNVFEELLEGLAKSMGDMCTKLPERFGKLKARAELAQRTVEALKA